MEWYRVGGGDALMIKSSPPPKIFLGPYFALSLFKEQMADRDTDV